jgi:hypothetical protein
MIGIGPAIAGCEGDQLVAQAPEFHPDSTALYMDLFGVIMDRMTVYRAQRFIRLNMGHIKRLWTTTRI